VTPLGGYHAKKKQNYYIYKIFNKLLHVACNLAYLVVPYCQQPGLNDIQLYFYVINVFLDAATLTEVSP